MEAMLYGEGYVAEAVLTSPFIDIGSRKGLVSIEWEAPYPRGTGVEITTRTGNTLSEAYIYHDNTARWSRKSATTRGCPTSRRGRSPPTR